MFYLLEYIDISENILYCVYWGVPNYARMGVSYGNNPVYTGSFRRWSFGYGHFRGVYWILGHEDVRVSVPVYWWRLSVGHFELVKRRHRRIYGSDPGMQKDIVAIWLSFCPQASRVFFLCTMDWCLVACGVRWIHVNFRAQDVLLCHWMGPEKMRRSRIQGGENLWKPKKLFRHFKIKRRWKSALGNWASGWPCFHTPDVLPFGIKFKRSNWAECAATRPFRYCK